MNWTDGIAKPDMRKPTAPAAAPEGGPMVVVLNFSHHDHQQALRLLQWMNQLGVPKTHDLILQYSPAVRNAELHRGMKEEAEKCFLSVSTVVTDGEDERGWPFSPNFGWSNALRIIREKVMRPWLWLEPDCVVLSPIFLTPIEDAYKRLPKNKVFLGADVAGPPRRLSGIAVYPPRVVTYLQKRHLGDLFVRNEAFDAYFAPEWMPFSATTNLIQNVYRSPDNAPTFPDAASLSLLSPDAVLFHRCKDGTLIERLHEKLVRTYVVESLVAAKDSFNTEGRAGIEQLEDQLKVTPLPAPENKRTTAQQAAIDARIAKAMATKAKKAARKAKMKAAWQRRKAKALV